MIDEKKLIEESPEWLNPNLGGIHMAAGRCKAAYHTDEYHGYGCSITEGACMFIYPDSKACAEKYGEGPDAEEMYGSGEVEE